MEVNNKKLSQIWWADNHPLDNVQLAWKHFPNLHYSDIGDKEIEYIFKIELANSLKTPE